MYIRKYTHDYSRRHFLSKIANGVVASGVLCSPWHAFAKTGDTQKAYPDELNSIDAYTKGKLKAGDIISKDNVHLIKDLIDPVRHKQINELGRKLILSSTTTDLYKLNPVEYIEATLRNAGKARFDQFGNVVTLDGNPWVGGNPFPNPQSAAEVFAGHTLSWGRHDSSVYICKEYDLDAKGILQYEYHTAWAEMATVARVSMSPKPYLPGFENKLRYQSIFFNSPSDVKGVAYLNIWPYDQREFPELYGYIPAFKRIRRFPTNQRFEVLNPGSELYMSDAWAAGDPFLTWGEYQIIHRGPYLAGVSGGWDSSDPNWEHQTHGGATGKLFWNTKVELVPEAIVVEAKPIGYPRAPISKKRVWFDARTLLPLAMISYDRRGEPFRFFDGSYSLYDDGKNKVLDGKNPYWSWATIHAFNVQTGRMSRIEQVREMSGGHCMLVNNPLIYNKYLTMNSLQQFGG